MRIEAAKPTLALLAALALPAFLFGQSRPRPQTFEGVVTLRNPDAAPRPTASIGGIVVSEATGDPIAGATVTLSPHGNSRILALLSEDEPATVAAPVKTNANGVFSFEAIVAGGYNLTVLMDGYLPRTFERRGNNGDTTEIALKSGERLDNVRIGITRSARIEGRIRNATGQSFAGVSVELLQPGPLSRVAQARNGQDGSYNLIGFAPGRYFLMAGSPAVLKGDPARFFANEITVPNTDTLTLDFVLDRTEFHSIRGNLNLQAASIRPTGLNATIRVVQGGDSTTTLTEIQYNPQTGAFVIPAPFPGIYRINAQPTDPQLKDVCASADVLVSRGDVNGIDLILQSCLH